MNGLEKTIMYTKYISEDKMYYEECKDKQEVEFEVKGLGDKWRIETGNSVWKYYNISGMLIPMQGWKIHISVALNEAEEVLRIVSEVLISQEIAFKHIRSAKLLFEMYSKHGNRITSGKFITIYPQGEEFIEILNILEQKLKGFQKGPYILTDKRWKDTNIYFRYGAFKKMVSSTGELCLTDHEGKMVPDIREPRYYVPPFVKIPSKLLEADILPENKEVKENKLKLFKIQKALRYSNGGGIYLGERISDGLKCVIKEARAEIGYDGQKHSAEERLNNEYDSHR